MGLLHKLGHLLTPKAKITLYYGLIFPHLQYGIIFWSAVCKEYFQKLFKLQKSAVRILSGSGRYAHTADLFQKLEILNLYDINRWEMCKFVNDDLKLHHQFNFFSRSAIHNQGTRFQNCLALPRYFTAKAQKSVFYLGIKFFNELDLDFRNTVDRFKFKTKLKYLILQQHRSPP